MPRNATQHVLEFLSICAVVVCCYAGAVITKSDSDTPSFWWVLIPSMTIWAIAAGHGFWPMFKKADKPLNLGGLSEWTVIHYGNHSGPDTYAVYASDAEHAKQRAMEANKGWRFGQLDVVPGNDKRPLPMEANAVKWIETQRRLEGM